MEAGRKAVFLDRDGVLVRDVGLLTRVEDIALLEGVAQALARLQQAGYLLVGISNQTVVARGMVTEQEMLAIQREIEAQLVVLGAPALEAFYYCPHHPQATDPAYRCHCACRKPEPGLLLRASRELGVDLGASVMIGDRPTDVVAGQRAGCRTVWLHTGRHDDPPIVTSRPMPSPSPDLVCASLLEAAGWIIPEVAA